jgi:hypothetical protein
MDISDTLAPNSDQLDAVDLIGGPRTFTITDVTKGNAEQPVRSTSPSSPACGDPASPCAASSPPAGAPTPQPGSAGASPSTATRHGPVRQRRRAARASATCPTSTSPARCHESRDITTKTDRALPDAKHVASCGGTLLTGINAEALARMLGTAPVEAAS